MNSRFNKDDKYPWPNTRPAYRDNNTSPPVPNGTISYLADIYLIKLDVSAYPMPAKADHRNAKQTAFSMYDSEICESVT